MRDGGTEDAHETNRAAVSKEPGIVLGMRMARLFTRAADWRSICCGIRSLPYAGSVKQASSPL
jgi:hypothetical protein